MYTELFIAIYNVLQTLESLVVLEALAGVFSQ